MRRAASSEPTKKTMLFVGDYLRDDYLKVLQETRSPYQAGRSGGPQMVTVWERGQELHFAPGDFHQGYQGYLLRPDGTIGAEDQDDPKLELKIVDTHHFVLGFKESPPQYYAYVGDLDRYLRDLVLAGEYVDAAGQRYSFGSDGRAFFPSQKFEYSVGADHAFSDFDYYYVKKKADGSDSDFFGFRKMGGVLQIFTTSGELSEHLADKPMFSLRRYYGNTCCEKK